MKKLNYLNVYVVSTIAFIFLCYLMLPVRNSYMLRWYEEMSMFEPTRFFLRECLNYPGGIIRYAGSWLTQLMYYPMLGSTVLIVLWVIMAYLTKKAFCLSRPIFPLVYVVPMAMLVSIVHIDDAWISMKSTGYIYSNTLGYLFVVAALGFYRIVERYQLARFGLLIITTGCYPIAGFYALLAALIGVILMAAESVRNKRYAGIIYAMVIIIFILISPNIYYLYVQPTTVDNDFLYLKGLPDLLMETFDLYLWTPFIVATVSLLIFALMDALRLFKTANWMMWVSAGVLMLYAIWCFNADRKNEQLRATVLMLNRLERNDWVGMTKVMSRIKEPPNFTMLLLNNFALVSLGGEPEDIADLSPDYIDARHSEKFSMTAFVNIPINYYNGKFNISYRWGMEHCVQYGKRVFFLRYMIKDALLNGEIKLAKRYNDILLRTMFHSTWAKEMNRYIEDPSLIESNPEFKSILALRH